METSKVTSIEAGPAEVGEHVPYVTHDDYTEIRPRSVILGAVLSVVLGAANVYLGLLVGLTISASIPASVMSMAILRCFKDTNILESNIVQTAASAGEALAAGVIFTIPGLVILQRKSDANEAGFEGVVGWDTFLGSNYIYVTALALFGGLLGILFSIPIRRALILEIKPPLRFPEGVATAQVLRAGEAGGAVVWAVAAGAVLGSATKISDTIRLYNPVSGFGWLYAGKYPSYFGVNFSSALLAVGYIVGPQVGTVLLLGALTQYFIAMPISAYVNNDYTGEFSAAAVSSAEFGRTRYIGVGLMVVGGIWALISVRHALVQAIKFGLQTFRSAVADAGDAVVPRYEQDLSFKTILGGIGVSTVALYAILGAFSSAWGKVIPLVLLALVLAFIFSAVAAYMAGLLGSSNNPVSGVTICSSLAVSALILLLFGSGNPVGPPLAVITCCAIASACAISGDNIQDLKCGHILGATPWRQELVMCVGVTTTAFVVAPVLELLEKAYTIGGTSPTSLAAPQASVISTIPVGIINGGLPWAYIITGLVFGVFIIAADVCLDRMGSKFRLPVLAFAVAFYLPIYYMTPIFLGGIIHVLARTDPDNHSSEGVLYAAGLVAGDALTGILTAIPIVVSSDGAVLVPGPWKGEYEPPVWPSFVAGFFVLASLWYVGKAEPFTGGKLSNAPTDI